MVNSYKNIIGVLVLFVFLSGFVSCEDSYIESLQKLRDQITLSEKNIRDDVNSFNEAFKDTFILLDQEVSRLIYANAAMAGVIFAIMFLVYAKTTSRYKRDIQVLLAAHGKYIDNIITTRLEEFEARLDARAKTKDVTRLTKLGGEFDMIVSEVVDKEEAERGSRMPTKLEDPVKHVAVAESKDVVKAPIIEAVKAVEVAEKKSFLSRFKFKQSKQEMPRLLEAKIDSDGKVKILKGPSNPGMKFLKRIRRGLRRLTGKGKQTDEVKELKK